MYHLRARLGPFEIARDLDLDYLEKRVRFYAFTVANFIFRWGCHCRFREIAKKSAATRPARVRVTLTLTLALSHCTQPIQSPWDVNPSSQKTSPDQSSHQDERTTRKDPHGSTSDRCGPCTHRSRYGTLQPASHLERSCGLRCHEQPLLQHKARTCQKVIPHRHCAPDLGCFSSCAVLA